jgi:BCD family chlorophyll transporter-like MFS transporter
MEPHRLAALGALAGAFALGAVVLAAPFEMPPLYAVGTIALGAGAALFSVGTLLACVELARDDQAGLALGAWGAVQATAGGLAMAAGGVLRDVIASLAHAGALGAVLDAPATGYAAVYLLEIVLLFATLAAIGPLVRPRRGFRGHPLHPGLTAVPPR